MRIVAGAVKCMPDDGALHHNIRAIGLARHGRKALSGVDLNAGRGALGGVRHGGRR